MSSIDQASHFSALATLAAKSATRPTSSAKDTISAAKFSLSGSAASAALPAPSPVKGSGAVSAASLFAAQSSAQTSDASSSKSSSTTDVLKLSLPKAVNLVTQDTISLQLTASSSAKSVTFSAEGLPDWLAMSSSGKITGTVMAQENQTYDPVISVTDSDGKSVNETLPINVLARHYPGWNSVGGVTVVGKQAVTKSVTNGLGQTSSFTYALPETVP